MRVIIAGGRDFDDQSRVDFEMDVLAEAFLADSDIEVVCGEADGADQCGKVWAFKRGWPVKSFEPDYERWKGRERYAPLARNVAMAEYAAAGGALVAFWNDQSRGTKHMIDTALKHGLEVHVYRYERGQSA